MSDYEKVVTSFAKSAAEQVRARTYLFKGKRYADIRVYRQDSEGNWFPTKRGVALDVELVPKLREAVEALAGEAGKAVNAGAGEAG